MINEQLKSSEYAFINDSQKGFVLAFDEAMCKIGYESGGIVPYVCLGRYKIEYTKSGNKTKRFVARVYFRDYGIVLRLYFTNIDKHRQYIENAPEYIKTPFINDAGRCKQCDKAGGGIGNKGTCSFKKTYTINGALYEKCSGENYYFNNLELSAIPQYIELLETFYPNKKGDK